MCVIKANMLNTFPVVSSIIWLLNVDFHQEKNLLSETICKIWQEHCSMFEPLFSKVQWGTLTPTCHVDRTPWKVLTVVNHPLCDL